MHHLTQKDGEKREEEPICVFAKTNFRNQMRRFGIKLDDRRRHMYVIGKTGMGKTTMMENMVLNDIYSGHGVGIVDPHGDFAEKIIDYIPSSRVNDVVYLNPADVQYPIGFNILEVKSEEQKHLVAAGMMGTFKKIWPDVWSARMEYILNNTLLALLDYPNSTLLGINRLLADKKYRKKVVKQLKDPVIKSFWNTEFANYPDRYMTEAVAPIQNKIGQFLSANIIRNMVAQVKSTIDVREIMDSGKIFIMNLSKGRIGEDNSRLLGGMLITKIQLSAMERVDTPEEKRRDFFLYVDEFQNFATPSFANILSEARKYRLSLIMGHQYVAQLDELVSDAVFGNVGTIVTFRVGGADAELLVKEFTPQFLEEDIVNLAKFQVILKLMINGVASLPFTATTLSPIGSPTGSTEKIIRVSRERYAKARNTIEDKIMRWSGMEAGEDDDEDDDESIDLAPSVKKEDKAEKKNDAPKHVDNAVSKEKSNDDSRPKGPSQIVAPPKKQEKKEEPPPAPSISLKDLLPKEKKEEMTAQPKEYDVREPLPEGKKKRKRKRKKKKSADSSVQPQPSTQPPAESRPKPQPPLRLQLHNQPAPQPAAENQNIVPDSSPQAPNNIPPPPRPMVLDQDEIIRFD